MRFIKLALICMALGLAGCVSGNFSYFDTASNNTVSNTTLPTAETPHAIQAAAMDKTGTTNADQIAKLSRPAHEANIYLPIEPGRGDAPAVEVQKVEFKLGLSSGTVEKLAKQRGCSSAMGAGLVTDGGPIEVYRMNCRDGIVFMARCELRQCEQMQTNR